jgi:hypothetical protein
MSKKNYEHQISATKSVYSGWKSGTGPTKNAILNSSGQITAPFVPFPEDRHIFFPRNVAVLNIFQAR